MSPDDPRHGTPAGESAHRAVGEKPCPACAAANALYQRRTRKVRALYGSRMVSTVGSARRLQALMCLGWSMTRVGERIGMEAKHMCMTIHRPIVRRSTAEKIAAIYDELSDTPAVGVTKADRISIARTLGHATRRGYAPPIAWDDNIDDPDAEPYAGEDGPDDVVVERLLAGHKVPSRRVDKVEAMRRHLAAGGSQRSLCRMHGWAENRYVVRQDGAA